MRGSWKAGGIAVLLTLVSVALAYQVPAVIAIDLGQRFPSSLALEGFHDTEAGYRWSRAASRIVFRDPGGYRDALIELELAGFRPPGMDPPLVVVEAEGRDARLRPSRRIDWYSLETRTSGWWSSDVVVTLRSETFSPGAGDERALGVRVHRARLRLPGGTVPPLRQLLLTGLLVALWFRWWRASPRALAAAAVLGVVVAGGFAFARAGATFLVPVAAIVLAALAVVELAFPSLARFASDAARASARALAVTATALSPRRLVVLVALTVLGIGASYRITPRFEIDLGSGEAAGIATRFGPLDRDDAVTFQIARAGAELDLRDFGSGSPWTVAVHASASRTDRARASGVLVRAGGRDLDADVGESWERFELHVAGPPAGWRPGPVLAFPGLGAGTELRIDRVAIERGASWPPLRPTALLLGATIIVAAALGSTLAGGVFAALALIAVALEPVITLPFLPTLVAGAVATGLVGAGARGLTDVATRRDWLPALSPRAMTLALGGFLLWFVAVASPLYVGGHYGFHTDIAEEIWHGQFLIYYLPYPGSMLSRQPQWDHVIVPHSCLFHTVAAPLAAMPRAWFHTLTKLFLASLLFGITLSTAMVATRVASPRAGTYAAAASVLIPTGFQLLGLGHLMTLFGTWAAALALGFLVVHVDELDQRALFGWAVALVSLCCLSYTGSLLFASIAIAATGALTWQRRPAVGKRLASVLVLAWGVAFLLYYIHWTLPFLRDSVPVLLSGTGGGGGIDLLGRIGSQPGKLGYTFGSVLVPVVGLAGLSLAHGTRRLLLYSWAGVLVGFAALDVFFNFLLKHHYFAYPAVAIGLGLALDWLHGKSWLSRMISVVFVVSLLWMGFREAIAVATGAY